MNKQVHRLVFDRRRGMRVPAAEHVRSAGKAGGGQTRAVALACAMTLLAMADEGVAGPRSLSASIPRSATAWTGRTTTKNTNDNLPVRSPLGSSRRSGDTRAEGFGITYLPDGTSMRVDQTDRSIIINWDSFNIGRGYSVHFQQPTGGAALNKIWDLNPTVILGKLTATGEVILENTNGVIFGPTGRVETQRFVATALSLSRDTFLNGIRNNAKGEAIFGSDADSAKGFVSVERGAEIKALAGGDVMLIGPKVYNEGRIETPSGQAILAAGQKVYLFNTTADPAQRGLLVAVDAFLPGADGAAPLPDGTNTVEQAEGLPYQPPSEVGGTEALAQKINAIVAEKGSINLVGMTIRQNGVLSATTAVKGQNGAVYLQASKRTDLAYTSNSEGYRFASELGSVELGSTSRTTVTADANASATQKDAETFNRSRIQVVGQDVRVASGAQVVAHSGEIGLTAVSQVNSDGQVMGIPTLGQGGADGSHLVVDSGALIDASGERDVVLSMARNQQAGRLFQIELADSPVQRGGVLYRSAVQFDARDPVQVANVKGFYSAIERSAQELSTKGGKVTIQGQGDVVVLDGAKVDVSGGSVKYQDGVLSTSYLRQGNRLVRFSDAKANQKYDELITGQSGAVTPGYVEGADAGSAQVAGFGKTYAGLSGFKAGVVVGPRQRGGRVASSYAADVLKNRPDLYSTLRPQAGLITIGKLGGNITTPIWFGGAIQLSAQRALPLGEVPELGTPEADQFFAALPAVTEVSSAELGQTQLGQLTLIGAQDITIGKDVALNLGASGILTLQTAQSVSVAGALRAEGGAVNVLAKSGDFTLAEGGVIDLAGRQLDELGRASGSDPLSVDGGKLSVQAHGSAVFSEGSAVDVSAGVWRSASGALSKGVAGALDVKVNQGLLSGEAPTGQMVAGGQWSAYDFQSGGTLSLSGMRTLAIGDQNVVAKDGGLALSSSFFSDHGFGTFKLSALGDVDVLDRANVQPVIKNLAMATSRVSRGTERLTTVQTLADVDRQAATLNLEASSTPLGVGGEALPGFEEGGRLTIGRNARVDVGMGGTLSLKAGRSMLVNHDAELVAHGGQIALALAGTRENTQLTPETSTNTVGYLADQEIRLAAGSLLDVSGTALTTASRSLGTGKVLGGGTVNLNYTPGTAVRGMVVTEVGSKINVSGTSAELRLDRGQVSRVSKGAGTLNLGATDGFLLQGEMVADRPDASVSAGTFNASVSTERSNDFVKTGTTAYPGSEHTLILEASEAKVAEHNTGHLKQGAFGQGVVSTEQLAKAGFERIQLRADDGIVMAEGSQLVAGEGKAALSSVILNTRALKVLGRAQDAHRVQAAYVSLGDRDLQVRPLPTPVGPPQAVLGTAKLDVYAGLIEVHGHSALQGLDTTLLSATLGADGVVGSRRDGEVRFIGRALTGQSALTGSLNFDGDLEIEAGQAYASTLSKFTVQGVLGKAADARQSRLTVSGPRNGQSSTSRTPMSALVSLSLQAHDVVIKGVVRQPFGTIDILAETRPELRAGSLLSVSGDGVTVPVGTTVNEREWVYSTTGTLGGVDPKADGVQVLDGLSVDKGITVKGRGLKIDGTSEFQAQAGGDLLAWEFIAGVGGSTDTLNRKNVFAILPTYQYDFAPFDTEINASTLAAGTTLNAGDKVTVNTDNGVLAKGSYTLLPARYGVLPGAVLVSETSLPANVVAPTGLAQDDGSVFVSGYKSTVGSQGRGGNDSRLALLLEPESTFRAKSTLQTTSINEYLASQAGKAGQAMPNRPGDAGRVSLISTTDSFDWSAKYQLGGASGFEAGAFDLVMPNMAVVKEGEAAPNGFGAVTVNALEALAEDSGARSILLGGTRSVGLDGATVTTLASSVLFNTSVSVSELLAVAKDRVVVAEGVTLKAEGAASGHANRLEMSGQGAALMLSNRLGTTITRDLSGSADDAGLGQLDVGKKVTITAVAAQVDGSRLVKLDPSLNLTAQSLGLGAPRIAIGGASEDQNALVVGAKLLEDKSRLQLRSYSSIDLMGGVGIGQLANDGTPTLQSLVIDAPTVRGLGKAGDVVSVQAQHVSLLNGSKLTPVAADEVGTSKLVITARPPVKDATAEGIALGGGRQRLAFTSADLNTTGDVVFHDGGAVTAQSDVTVSAARVTANTAARQSLDSGGVLSIRQADAKTARTLGDRVGAGAQLSLSGQRVVQSGTIDLPSGQLNITGRGQVGNIDTVVFDAGSKTLANGFVVGEGQVWATTAPGGSIKATAEQGRLVLGGLLDVSVPVSTASTSTTSATAGSVTLIAHGETGAGGTLVIKDGAQIKGGAATHANSGMATVDARHLDSGSASVAVAASAKGTLDNLARLLNDGGFHREIDVRVREGNLSLNTGLTAARVILSADAGSLTLKEGASIDATAVRGGVVQLSSGGDLSLLTGARIKADSSAEASVGANGGDVLLASSGGKVVLQKGVAISAGGDDEQDGRVVIRAQRDDSQTSSAEQRLNVSLDATTLAQVKAGQVVIESVRTYEGTALAAGASQDSVLGQATLESDSDTFMAGKDALLAGLGLGGLAKVHLRSGVEIRAADSFDILDDWNLWDATHAGGESISLTIRAKGDVNVNGTLSDGFAAITPTMMAVTDPKKPTTKTEVATPILGDGASLRITAGADLKAAGLTQTNGAAESGSLTVAGDKMIRTTSGSIELAAARDVTLGQGNAQAVVYVAGKPSAAPASMSNKAVSVWASYGARGGRLDVHAGGNIKAPAASQLFGNWLYHLGAGSATSAYKNVEWFTALGSFKQGLGSMGGGNVRVVASGDIDELGVVAPTSARTVAVVGTNGEATTYRQVVENGGDVLVRAGGDVHGGVYLIGRGDGRVEAGGSVTAGLESGLAPILGLMDGQWAVQAHDDLQLAGIYNPTVVRSLTKGSKPRVDQANAGAYFTYGDASSLSLNSVRGDVALTGALTSELLVSLHNDASPLSEQIDFKPADEEANPVLLAVAPPTLNLTSIEGQVSMDDSINLILFPSKTGNLSIYAGGDVRLAKVTMGDSDPANWTNLTVSRPTISSAASYTSDITGNNLEALNTVNHASTLHQDDSQAAWVHAGQDLVVSGGNGLSIPKAADISAGGDIKDLAYTGQHFRDSDVTRISAGGNFIGLAATSRTDGLIQVGGLGELQVEAGRNLDLSVSGGIETSGKLSNAALPEQGAHIRVMAGARKQVDVEALASQFMTDESTRADLVTFVQKTLKVSDLSYEQALDHFRGMSMDHQVSFADQYVFTPRFVATYVQSDQAGVPAPYQQAWVAAAKAAGVKATDYTSIRFRQFKDDVVMKEVQRLGDVVSGIALSDNAAENARREAARQVVWDQIARTIDLAGLGAGFKFSGDIDLAGSKIYTQGKGDRTHGGIDLFAPGGQVLVGLSTSTEKDKLEAATRGLVAYAGGSIRSLSSGDFQVNSQKAFVVGSGDLLVYTGQGDIDAGRGSNTDVTVPPPVAVKDPLTGVVTFVSPAVTTGSGIGILKNQDGSSEGAVSLLAPPPHEVRALDAYIQGPTVNLPGKVLGADNVQGPVKGQAPPPTVTVNLSVNSGLGTEAAAGEAVAAEAASRGKARERGSLLTVELLGLGDQDNAPGAGDPVPSKAKDDETKDCPKKNCVR